MPPRTICPDLGPASVRKDPTRSAGTLWSRGWAAPTLRANAVPDRQEGIPARFVGAAVPALADALRMHASGGLLAEQSCCRGRGRSLELPAVASRGSLRSGAASSQLARSARPQAAVVRSLCKHSEHKPPPAVVRRAVWGLSLPPRRSQCPHPTFHGQSSFLGGERSAGRSSAPEGWDSAKMYERGVSDANATAAASTASGKAQQCAEELS